MTINMYYISPVNRTCVLLAL